MMILNWKKTFGCDGFYKNNSALSGLRVILVLTSPISFASWLFQTNAFRTLRFLFSMERNRRLFKRLFPPDLFEMFIDIGHYKRELEAYHSLVEKINTISVSMMNLHKK